MPEKVDVLQLICSELKDIKDNQKEMRTELTSKFSAVHRRVDDLVKDRYQCELACKERDNRSKERDSDLKEKIWKTSGIVAGAINIVVEGIKWTISKFI